MNSGNGNCDCNGSDFGLSGNGFGGGSMALNLGGNGFGNNNNNNNFGGNNNNNNNNFGSNNNKNNGQMDLSNLPVPKQNGNLAENPLDVRNNGNTNANSSDSVNHEMLMNVLKQIKENKNADAAAAMAAEDGSPPKEETKVKIILLGLVTAFGVASALSWHEAIKYFISRSIKFSGGTPMYYLYYALGATVLTGIMFTQSKKMLN